jgi:hypothetical protein
MKEQLPKQPIKHSIIEKIQRLIQLKPQWDHKTFDPTSTVTLIKGGSEIEYNLKQRSCERMDKFSEGQILTTYLQEVKDNPYHAKITYRNKDNTFVLTLRVNTAEGRYDGLRECAISYKNFTEQTHDTNVYLLNQQPDGSLEVLRQKAEDVKVNNKMGLHIFYEPIDDPDGIMQHRIQDAAQAVFGVSLTHGLIEKSKHDILAVAKTIIRHNNIPHIPFGK